jgi:NitT/TauT family transport system substrate-binding protein
MYLVSRQRRLLLYILGLILIAPLLFSCGSGDSDSDSDADGGLTGVTLRLDWTLSGQQAPFILAKSRGYYEDAGLDVTIDEGSGSTDGAKLVGTGQIDFAVVDASVIGSSRQEGLPIKSVAVLYQHTPVCILWLSDRVDIDGPQSLAGSDIRLGINERSAHAIGIQAMFAAQGIDENNVDIVPIGQGTSTLAAGRLDAMGGLSNVDPPILESQGLDVGTLDVADYGVQMYGLTLAANESTITDDPELVKAFVDATRKGWDDAKADPDAAIAALLDVYPDGDHDLDMSILQATLALADGPDTADAGIGAQTSAGWEATATVLHDTGITDSLIPASDMFSTVAFDQ